MPSNDTIQPIILVMLVTRCVDEDMFQISTDTADMSHTHTCIHVSIYICMYACTSECIHEGMYERMGSFKYVYMYVFMLQECESPIKLLCMMKNIFIYL